MLNYRRNGQQKYFQRCTANISLEWELLQKVKDIAAQERYTLSEIVGQCLVEFINKHKSKG